MKAISTLAVGDRMYGDMALNLALSVRASSDSIPIVLYYTPSAVEGIEELITKAFTHLHKLPDTDNPVRTSYEVKLHLDELLPQGIDEMLFIDADTIILPGRRIKDWFEQLADVKFTAYCNDQYDFLTKKRKRTDYMFWCDPEAVFYLFPVPVENKMPQVNASFIYFKKGETATKLFSKAREIWADSGKLKYTECRGSKTEEMCFNIACAITGILPHRTTFRPIFFQYQAESWSAEGIYHHYRALGLAGEIVHDPAILDLYNRLSLYYRGLNGIVPEFKITQDKKGLKIVKDEQPIEIPFVQRTIYRAGELPGTQAGIFNPDASVVAGQLVEVFRTESSFDAYRRYKNTTAVPVVRMGDSLTVMTMDGWDEKVRVEDFRMIDTLLMLVSHSVVTNNHTPKMVCRMAISSIAGTNLELLGYVQLPIETEKVEKNWVFFIKDKRLYCIYSLSPLTIFSAPFTKDRKWRFEQDTVADGVVDWFHKSRISISTRPVLVGDKYVIWFHTKQYGKYFHGVALLDRDTLQLTHYTRHSISMPFPDQGWQRGLLYVSGAVFLEREGVFRVYAGEGDTNAIHFDFDALTLINEVKKYPA